LPARDALVWYSGALVVQLVVEKFAGSLALAAAKQVALAAWMALQRARVLLLRKGFRR